MLTSWRGSRIFMIKHFFFFAVIVTNVCIASEAPEKLYTGTYINVYYCSPSLAECLIVEKNHYNVQLSVKEIGDIELTIIFQWLDKIFSLQQRCLEESACDWSGLDVMNTSIASIKKVDGDYLLEFKDSAGLTEIVDLKIENGIVEITSITRIID